MIKFKNYKGNYRIVKKKKAIIFTPEEKIKKKTIKLESKLKKLEKKQKLFVDHEKKC